MTANTYTKAALWTAEDSEILNRAILRSDASCRTLVEMLCGNAKDSRAFSDGEWETFWIKRQQYELDYIY